MAPPGAAPRIARSTGAPLLSHQVMEPLLFYKFPVEKQVFYRTAHTFALVNLKPLVPGHVLVVPKRTSVLRFGDLTAQESVDYMAALQRVQGLVRKVYKADALNLAIQDGPEAGQLVPHLHTHVIPRFRSDARGDSIHTQLERSDLVGAYEQFFQRRADFLDSPGWKSTPDEDRHPRSEQEMAEEAAWLRLEMERYELEEKE